MEFIASGASIAISSNKALASEVISPKAASYSLTLSVQDAAASLASLKTSLALSATPPRTCCVSCWKLMAVAAPTSRADVATFMMAVVKVEVMAVMEA